MSVQSIVVHNISHCQAIQTPVARTTCRMEREKDGPKEYHSDQAYHSQDLEKAQKEISIER